MEEELINLIGLLIEDLRNRNYDAIVCDGRIGSLTKLELQSALAGYGKKLIPFPKKGWKLIEKYPIAGRRNEVALDVPLWTLEEGRSDLVLLLKAVQDQSEWRIEIEDVRIL